MSLAFNLPAEREAHRPPEARGLSRDAVSLLVSDARANTHTVTQFTNLADYLRSGDLLIVNDSATIPAALEARRTNGDRIQLHLSTRISDALWIVEPRHTPAIAIGERFSLPANAQAILLSPVHRSDARLWYANLTLPESPNTYLTHYAKPISYNHVDAHYPIDMYQTIFARNPGSAEMPSAARPFSLRVLDSLYRKGIEIAPITLHCGVATPETHEPPLDERFTVPDYTATAVNTTRSTNNRIIAIGTTTVRALESAGDSSGTIHPTTGWTSHIVTPSNPPHTIDALLTGFHEPRASHLLMLESLADSDFLSEAYTVALEHGLLWHEFGDVHLILR